MPRTFVHFAFLSLALTGVTGLWMRLVALKPNLLFTSYEFLLHAHSHIAILGWTFIAIYCIFLYLVWNSLKRKKQAITIGILTIIISLSMFVAFLIQGYALFSIIFSILHIFMEYWLAIFMYQTIKQHRFIPKLSSLFLKGAIVSLILSTFGPFLLGILAGNGLKDSVYFDMSIYFYLHFQYNGWLYFSLIGLFIWILYNKNILMRYKTISVSFWIYIFTLVPAYLLSILWFDLGEIGENIAVIGAAGQLIAIVLLLFSIWTIKPALQHVFSSHLLISLLFVFLLLGMKSISEIGLLYEPLATFIYETRSIVIGYLHLTFLGFISIFLLTQLQMIGALDETRNSILYGIGIFISGFVLNEIILLSTGAMKWLNYNSFPFAKEAFILASLLLVAGVFIIWLGFITRKKQRIN